MKKLLTIVTSVLFLLSATTATWAVNNNAGGGSGNSGPGDKNSPGNGKGGVGPGPGPGGKEGAAPDK